MRTYVRAKTLAENLRRSLDGRTQSSIAKDLGVSQAQVSRLLSGQFKTANRLIKNACAFCGVKPEQYAIGRGRASVGEDVVAAVKRACAGSHQKAGVIVRVLRVLEGLDYPE